MGDLRVVVPGNDGIPREMFSGDTARMNREAQARLKSVCEDAVPSEIVDDDTMRIDETALSGLIQMSEGMAVGTPSCGVRLTPEEPEIEIAAEPALDSIVQRETRLPVLRQSRMHDIMIGGALSLVGMIVWYCATQL